MSEEEKKDDVKEVPTDAKEATEADGKTEAAEASGEVEKTSESNGHEAKPDEEPAEENEASTAKETPEESELSKINSEETEADNAVKKKKGSDKEVVEISPENQLSQLIESEIYDRSDFWEIRIPKRGLLISIGMALLIVGIYLLRPDLFNFLDFIQLSGK